MRLIDADALIVEIKTCLWDWESVNGIKAKTVLNQTITDIGNMPTIDAVPVVRCKDCKHRQELRECPMYHLNYARYEWQLDDDCDDYTKDDGFCDKGERKDDADNR